MKKVYYQLEMYQKSPLRIGNGDNEIADSDLMVDAKGCPFIPGSSVAGVLRDLYTRRNPDVSEEEVNNLFGYIEGEQLSESHILVSDATGPENASPSDYFITVRDGIRLDEWGTAVSENKYDFQVTETKKPYYTVLEWTGEDKDWKTEIVNGLEPLMSDIAAKGISFGAGTTRGYGKMEVSIRKKEFDFPQDIQAWLKFDPLTREAFEKERVLEAKGLGDAEIKIQAEIKVERSFSVPVCNYEEKPLISGTSWAGIFRHHMRAILRNLGLDRAERCGTELNLLFGMGEAEGEHIRSGICFGETVVDGSIPYSIQRNAVDRFTQAPRNTALFLNELWNGGKGRLDITVERSRINKLQAQLLAISLIDLDLGLMTFGGGTGVGLGRCRISCIKVNGKDFTQNIKKQDSNFLEEYL